MTTAETLQRCSSMLYRAAGIMIETGCDGEAAIKQACEEEQRLVNDFLATRRVATTSYDYADGAGHFTVVANRRTDFGDVVMEHITSELYQRLTTQPVTDSGDGIIIDALRRNGYATDFAGGTNE